jgi:hypothetical protein
MPNKNGSTKLLGQKLFLALTIILLLLGMFIWLPSTRDMFWYRRFFILVSGISSLGYIMLYNPKSLRVFTHRKILLWIILASAFTLLLRSSISNAVFGSPFVHPALGSLIAALCIGLSLTTIRTKDLLRGMFYIIVWWGTVCLLYWITGHDKIRLGFIDTQIIYAAYLFMIGIIIGSWLVSRKLIPDNIGRLGLVLLIICLVLTQTRSAIVLTFLYVLWAHRRDLVIISKRTIFTVFAISISVFLIFNFFTRLMNVSYFGESSMYRYHLLAASFPISNKELLFGGGMKSIEKNIIQNSTNYPDLYTDIYQKGVRFESSHNYYADLLVERGVTVVLLYSILLYQVLRKTSYRMPEELLVIKGLLVTTCLFLAVNNINLQIEVIFWILALQMLIKDTMNQ